MAPDPPRTRKGQSVVEACCLAPAPLAVAGPQPGWDGSPAGMGCPAAKPPCPYTAAGDSGHVARDHFGHSLPLRGTDEDSARRQHWQVLRPVPRVPEQTSGHSAAVGHGTVREHSQHCTVPGQQ